VIRSTDAVRITDVLTCYRAFHRADHSKAMPRRPHWQGERNMAKERIRTPRVLIALAIAAIGGLLVVGTVAAQGGRPFFTSLSGAAEIPGPGDPDGTGSAALQLNQGQGTICYELEVAGIDPATAAHIHVINTAAGTGPVLVTLDARTDGSSSACAEVSAEVIKAIRQNPEGYYVNVHNAAFPGGAVRGDLSK
jgi:hypothetical protein